MVSRTFQSGNDKFPKLVFYAVLAKSRVHTGQPGVRSFVGYGKPHMPRTHHGMSVLLGIKRRPAEELRQKLMLPFDDRLDIFGKQWRQQRLLYHISVKSFNNAPQSGRFAELLVNVLFRVHVYYPLSHPISLGMTPNRFA